MNPAAGRFVSRLLSMHLLVHVVSFLVAGAFAPQTLLLGSAAASAWLVVLFIALVVTSATSVVTILATRQVTPTLRALAVGSPAVESAHLVALNALPARLSLWGAIATLVACALSVLLPVLPGREVYVRLTLSLHVLTMASTAALVSYVLSRRAVSRVLELAPTSAAKEAMRSLGRGAIGRVRVRLVAAVAAPVAFVALGASLLVAAHTRAYLREAEAATAAAVVKASLEPIGDDTYGAERVKETLRRYRMETAEERERVDREALEVLAVGDDGAPFVRVEVGRSVLRVGLGPAQTQPITAVYVLLAIVAISLAGLLGTRVGVAFESDLAVATRAIRRTGVAEVMRGTALASNALFQNVQALFKAIGSLGGIFRQFASAQQRAIGAREATERMRALLLASMSHDLKAPLNAVLGFAQIVQRSELTEGQRESLAIIEQRGRELLVLIDTILDSARVEAGELDVAPEPTMVGDFVMAAVLEARDLSVGSDVQVSGEVQPGMPQLFVDGTRIVQALTAVILTAVRFSHKGIVPVRATMPGAGDRLRVEVETSGEGLPVNEREKIFDAFKSAESARRQGGLGLGLQLARAIIEIHAGTIEVDSTGGGGMVFRMWLPVKNDRDSIRMRATRQASVG